MGVGPVSRTLGGTTMAFAHVINDDFDRDLRERRAHLMRLRFELARNRVWVQVRKPRNGRWKLTLRSSTGWPETVMCGGGDGVHAYVTASGRLLGSVDDVRNIARVLAWMIEGNHRRPAPGRRRSDGPAGS